MSPRREPLPVRGHSPMPSPPTPGTARLVFVSGAASVWALAPGAIMHCAALCMWLLSLSAVFLRFTQGSVHLFPLLLFHKHIRSDVLFVMNTQASTVIEHKDDCCCCSVTKSRLTLCDPMDCSTPVFPDLHCLQEFAQTHVH